MKNKLFTLLVFTLCATQTTNTMYRARAGMRTFKTTSIAWKAFRTYRVSKLTLGVLLGLGIADAPKANQTALANTQRPDLSTSFDVTDIRAVLETLQEGTEQEKREVATQVANNIMHYSITEIISFLQYTKKRPHRTIIKAVAEHITEFDTRDIMRILQQDPQEDTHLVIARALKRNCVSYMHDSHSYATLIFTHSPIMFLAELVQILKPQYQGMVINGIIEHADLLSVRDLRVVKKVVSDTEHKQALAIEIAKKVITPEYTESSVVQDKG